MKKMNSYDPIDGDVEEIATKIIDSSFNVHSSLGPGLLSYP